MASVVPYPWSGLPRLPRSAVQRARALRRAVDAAFDLDRLSEVLGNVIGAQVRIAPVAVHCGAADDRVSARLAFELAGSGVWLELSFDPALGAELVSSALERRGGVGDAFAPSGPELLGAAAALIVETARRIATDSGAFVVHRSRAEHRAGLSIEAAVRVAGRSYAAFAELSGDDPRPAPIAADRLLARLRDVELSLAVVAGLSSAQPAQLQGLAPGDVWLPGGRSWTERAALAPPLGTEGVAVELTSQGVLVLRGQRVELATDVEQLGESMAESKQAAETALDAPLVVRIELGSVSLTGREWAELRPGDVLETRQPIGQDVVLRIAGREVARGELVDIDGELGVRIRSLSGEASGA